MYSSLRFILLLMIDIENYTIINLTLLPYDVFIYGRLFSLSIGELSSVSR